MKQGKLDFSAGKRTGSMTGVGKPQAKAGATLASFFTPVAAVALPASASASATSEAVKTTPAPPIAAKTSNTKRIPQPRKKAKQVAGVEDTDDDIEPADDFDYVGSDTETESVSSVTTFETVEEKDTKPASVPAVPMSAEPVGSSQGRTTRSQAAAAKNGVKAKAEGVTPTPTPTPKKRRIIKDEPVEVLDEIESAGDMDVDWDRDLGKDVFRPSNATDEEVARRVEANSVLGGGSGAGAKENLVVKEKEKEKEPTELKVKAVKWRKYHDKLKQKYGNLPTSEFFPSCFSRRCFV